MTVDLFGNRANETYTYRRVTWDWVWDVEEPDVPHAGPEHFHEGADLGDVVSGSIEMAAFTDLKSTCSFNFLGREAPEQDGLIRVYYSFTDDHGEQDEFALGTFLIAYSNVDKTDDRMSGTAEGYSLLKVLSDKECGLPFTVVAGDEPVALAVSLMESVGLKVNVAEGQSYQLAKDYTFEASDSYLTVVNWLLTAADCMAVTTDAYGVCQVRKRAEQDSVAAVFESGDNSIMYPEVSTENDWQSTPNVVRTYYEDETCALYAYAKNLRGSKASLDNRGGRELTLYESVSELEGDTIAQKSNKLKAAALSKLLDNSGEIERVSFSHPYIPLVPYDGVTIRYGSLDWTGNVTNIRVTLEPSTRCDTETRKLVYPTIETEVFCDILWEA